MASDGTILHLRGQNDPIRVLLADDEPGLRVALTELLSHEERVELVGTAADAEEAMRIAESNLPDVALVDVRMPEGGGPHAARGITRVSPGTRVIALSAYEDRTNVLEMLRAGAVGYLVKGTAADELVQGIEKVAQGGTSLSAEVMSGVVAELATQLRREEIERDADLALRGDIERLVTGHGLSMVYHPIMDPRDPRGDRGGGARTVRLHPREAAGSLVRRGDRPRARSPTGAPHDEGGARRTPEDPGRRVPVHQLLPSHRSLHRARRTAGRHGERIVLEITEHEAIDDYGGLAEALEPLRARGLGVAVDDVGAGYASLRHALQLAPDMVKMDISLTHDIDRDAGRRALAAALISFAAETDMTIVAEGIETAGELHALRQLGVRYGQGFYLARPAPLE